MTAERRYGLDCLEELPRTPLVFYGLERYSPLAWLGRLRWGEPLWLNAPMSEQVAEPFLNVNSGF